MYVIGQLDKNGVCFGVSYTGDEISGDNIVTLEEIVPEGYATHAEYYCGRRFDGGEWAAEKELEQICDGAAEACEGAEPGAIPYETALLLEIKECLLLNMRISLEAIELAARSEEIIEAEGDVVNE